jgi:hypothetical protein
MLIPHRTFQVSYFFPLLLSFLLQLLPVAALWNNKLLCNSKRCAQCTLHDDYASEMSGWHRMHYTKKSLFLPLCGFCSSHKTWLLFIFFLINGFNCQPVCTIMYWYRHIKTRCASAKAAWATIEWEQSSWIFCGGRNENLLHLQSVTCEWKRIMGGLEG